MTIGEIASLIVFWFTLKLLNLMFVCKYAKKNLYDNL